MCVFARVCVCVCRNGDNVAGELHVFSFSNEKKLNNICEHFFQKYNISDSLITRSVIGKGNWVWSKLSKDKGKRKK